MKKQAMITGGSRGIGLAVADYLASIGYDLVLIANNPQRLDQVRCQLLSTYPECNISLYPLDLVDTTVTEKEIQKILEIHPAIDLLFNNAGIIESGMVDIKGDQLRDLFNVNAISLLMIGNKVAEQMRQNQAGYIINVASMAGILGVPKIGAYSATKAAIISYSKALFKELLSHNVRVTCLCPSVVNTDMTDDGLMDNASKIQPEDLVKSVDYLLSLSDGALVERLDIHCKPIALREFF
ncbi:SDR family NAD(P)-dependent oxidoreductase [Endozoicomonas sp. Mp262]|uniref:SDR family NAD(P)-dependent oxidoreductase n=1 Tax=Endozoicomonas sp. Mp262 TaxID=2919499 RepID=UPI0021DA4269